MAVSGGELRVQDVQLLDRRFGEPQSRVTPHAIGRHALALGLAEARFGRELGAETAAGRSPGKSATEDTKGRYSFPYGDFGKLHRCAVISGESRAGQYHHQAIEDAYRELLAAIDKKNEKKE